MSDAFNHSTYQGVTIHRCFESPLGIYLAQMGGCTFYGQTLAGIKAAIRAGKQVRRVNWREML